MIFSVFLTVGIIPLGYVQTQKEDTDWINFHFTRLDIAIDDKNESKLLP